MSSRDARVRHRSNLKVLMVVPYFPPHKGGVELFALNIAKELAAHHGWEVVVVTTAEEGCDLLERRSDRLIVYRLP